MNPTTRSALVICSPVKHFLNPWANTFVPIAQTCYNLFDLSSISTVSDCSDSNKVQRNKILLLNPNATPFVPNDNKIDSKIEFSCTSPVVNNVSTPFVSDGRELEDPRLTKNWTDDSVELLACTHHSPSHVHNTTYSTIHEITPTHENPSTPNASLCLSPNVQIILNHDKSISISNDSKNCDESFSIQNCPNWNPCALRESVQFTEPSDTIFENDPKSILCALKEKNVDRPVIGHLNINFIAPKFEPLVSIIKDNVDLLMVSETKIDDTFPKGQFHIEGYSNPIRLDRNRHGGGIIIFSRDDLSCHELRSHELPSDVECIFLEMRIRQSKWLIVAGYNPHKKTFLIF